MNFLNPVRDVWGWLNLADYEAAKEKATKQIVARFARGNVAFQNGWVLDERAVVVLSARGDAAIAHLNKMATTHNSSMIDAQERIVSPAT